MPSSTVRRVGIAIGIVLSVGIAVLLHQDRQARIDAAHRQSLALASGVDRLLHYGLRNLERAMRGIVADAASFSASAPAQANALLQESISGVVSRHAELHSIVLVDAQGRAYSAGGGDPGFATWRARPAAREGLVVGPLHADGRGGWLLSLALPAGDGRWLLARLRTTLLERMIDGLDLGRQGSIAILDHDGVVLARMQHGHEGRFVGVRTQLPGAIRAGQGFSQRTVSPLDGVERAAGFSASSDYALVVSAGIALEEAVLPWYPHAWIALALLLLYWLGLGYLVLRLTFAERMRAEMVDELRTQAEWLEQAQQAAGTGVWRLEPDQRHLWLSAHAAAIYGFDAVATVLPTEQVHARVHPDDRQRVVRHFNDALQAGANPVSEFRIVCDDGSDRWISAHLGQIVDSSGRCWATGTLVDITERREARERIARAEAQFRALFERNPLPFWVFDAETLRFLAVNGAAIDAYGYSAEEFLSMTILDIRPRSEAARVVASMAMREANEDVDGVWIHERRDGSPLEVRVFSSGIEFGGRAARLVLAEDVSDRMAYERDLSWRATHDSLTGLSNVETLIERLDALEELAPGVRYTVAWVRLRDLELVAPTLGRRTSEWLLREVATRIEQVGREFGMSAFRPGESFLLVARDVARGEQMLAALLEAIAQPVHTEGGAHPIEASIGLAEGPGAGEGAEQVIGHAALAALNAEQEQVPVLAFDHAMAEEAGERMVLARRLRDAIDKGEFELHFQPIQRLSDGTPVALEALLRWRRGGALVSPGLFIPLAEASGLIVPIGRWVLAQAAREHARLSQQGLGHLSIAVNVSAVQLLADSVSDAISEAVAGHGLRPGALHVELTESAVLRQPQVARARMQALREAGIPISIDDFGTGFSSMTYLRDLPLDYLKIDRSFVRDVHLDPRNASICRALIALARGLGLGTIAEGVEAAGELDWLRENGCDQAQGYLLGRPVPLQELIDGLSGSRA